MTERVADVIVLGGGAAGLMCAIEAGKRGRRVVVLERNTQVGRKILISGGGRCNFTNLDTRPENFLSANPHFAKSALARYTPEDFLGLVRKHQIPYHEKKLGQLFCDRSAGDIVNLLEKECAANGVSVETACGVEAVEHRNEFVVRTGSAVFRGESLVVATGGLSIPKIGAHPLGYQLARQFHVPVLPCRPALVPLTFAREEWARFADLAGVSMEVIVSAAGSAFREKMLFTHQGLSGPAILQASSYWLPDQAIEIDLLPDIDLTRLLCEKRAARDRAEVHNIIAAWLPRRFAVRWCEYREIGKPLPGLSDYEIEEISRALHRWVLKPAGTEGYAKAEVTAGGVDTREISSKTFECRGVKRLYFIGEVLDITGHLGGFNFQWAWASGHAAGQVA